MPVWSQSEYDSNNGKTTPISVDDYSKKIREIKSRKNATKKDSAESSNAYNSNRKKRLVERMHNATGDEAARLATLIYNEFYRTSRGDADDAEDGDKRWIATENGEHMLIDNNSGEVVAGAGKTDVLDTKPLLLEDR